MTFLFYPYFLNRFILQMLLRATQITSSYTVLSSHILPERHSLLGITSRLHITGKRYNNNALKLIAKKINNQEDLCKKKNRIRVTDNYLPDRFNYLSECHIKTGYICLLFSRIFIIMLCLNVFLLFRQVDTSHIAALNNDNGC